MQLVKPAPFKEALQKLGQRTPIAADLSSYEWSQVPVALRERAMFSAHVESLKFLQRTRDTIGDFLGATREQLTTPDGEITDALKMGSRAQFVDRMRELAISEGMGPLEPEDAGTVRDITSEQRLGLIFDIQTQAATRYGNWKQGMDPDVLDEFPAQRFIREVGVEKPRRIHDENEGEVRLKSDLAFWLAMNDPAIGGFGVPYGPWGFNSGMGVEDVDRAEAESLGLLTPGEKVEPVEQEFNDHLKASVSGLDPDLQEVLKSRFGDQIKIEDGAAWWKGDRAGKRQAGVAPATRQKAPEPPAEPPQPPEPAGPPPFPSDLSRLEVMRRLGGSTGAELVRDPATGGIFVRKSGNSAAHLREEGTANDLYRAMGVPVPEGRIYEGPGGPVQLTRYQEGKSLGDYLKTASPAEQAAVKARIAEHFAADALLGNWDVAGMGMDNILVGPDGTPLRIDNGGSLRFRAQGAAKTAEEWDGHAMELWTLRDPKANAQTAQIFGTLDAFQIARQIQRIDGQALLAAAPEELRPVLSARLENLRAIAAKSLEFEATNFVAKHADEVGRHMMGMRKADTFARLAPELKQGKPGDVVLHDKDGFAFDHLRTVGAKTASAPSKDEAYYDAVLKAVKTVNAHHAKGDTQYNQATLDAAAKLVPELEKLAAAPGPFQGMAKGYLQTLAHVEKAKGDVSKSVPKFEKITVKGAGGTGTEATKSVTQTLADYINSNGGSWDIIAEWAAAQGGSSASESSNAASAFFLERLQGISKSEIWASGGSGAAVRKLWGEKFERTWEMFHAGVQEILARTEFNGNDADARMIRILRTEQSKGTVPFGKGQKGRYARRVNASGSVFAPVFSGTTTVTAVPHTRITGTYFLERIPGARSDFFYGDHENEFTYIGPGLEAYNVGWHVKPDLNPGTDSTKWIP
ncbi:MAG: hypothetical protein JNL10_11415 [Verrucomicrobiales bacterium]|nr:hypothetical protein [Verrucomicrobiales bacterium]